MLLNRYSIEIVGHNFITVSKFIYLFISLVLKKDKKLF